MQGMGWKFRESAWECVEPEWKYRKCRESEWRFRESRWKLKYSSKDDIE